MEIGLRQWVDEQVGSGWAMLSIIHICQGAASTPHRAPHVVSVGYLALTNQTGGQTRAWRDIYISFRGRLATANRRCWPTLSIPRSIAGWLDTLTGQARLAFGRDGLPWGEEYVLERYELLYEAGLVAEAFADGRGNAMPTPVVPGEALQPIIGHSGNRCWSVARQIEISAGNFRPDAADIHPDPVTAHGRNGAGVTLHKQNFRRLVEKSGWLRKKC